MCECDLGWPIRSTKCDYLIVTNRIIERFKNRFWERSVKLSWERSAKCSWERSRECFWECLWERSRERSWGRLWEHLWERLWEHSENWLKSGLMRHCLFWCTCVRATCAREEDGTVLRSVNWILEPASFHCWCGKSQESCQVFVFSWCSRA